MHKYPDVLYGQYSAPSAEHAAGDIFYFDYGCITFWGLSQKQVRVPWCCHQLRLCARSGLRRVEGAFGLSIQCCGLCTACCFVRKNKVKRTSMLASAC